MKVTSIIPAFNLVFALAGFLALGLIIGPADAAETAKPKDATKVTKAANAKLLKELPFEDKQDFADAKRGFVAPLPNKGVIKNAQGRPVWDLTKFSFIKIGRAHV